LNLLFIIAPPGLSGTLQGVAHGVTHGLGKICYFVDWNLAFLMDNYENQKKQKFDYI